MKGFKILGPLKPFSDRVAVKLTCNTPAGAGVGCGSTEIPMFMSEVLKTVKDPDSVTNGSAKYTSPSEGDEPSGYSPPLSLPLLLIFGVLPPTSSEFELISARSIPRVVFVTVRLELWKDVILELEKC